MKYKFAMTSATEAIDLMNEVARLVNDDGYEIVSVYGVVEKQGSGVILPDGVKGDAVIRHFAMLRKIDTAN